MTLIRRLGWSSLALIALVGCDLGTSSTVPLPPPTSKPSPETPKDPTEIKPLPVEPSTKPADPKGATVDKLSDEEIAQIKKLPPEDQKIALEQVSCPVSGDHLGDPEMGVPIKQTIGARTFFICCGGCKDKVKNKPEEVLANLKK